MKGSDMDAVMHAWRKRIALTGIALLIAALLGSALNQRQVAADPPPPSITYLCFNPWTGAITWPIFGCQSGWFGLDLTSGPVEVCVSRYTSGLAKRSQCTNSEFPLTLGGETDVFLCWKWGKIIYLSPVFQGDCPSTYTKLVVLANIQTETFQCISGGDCPLLVPSVTGTDGNSSSTISVIDPMGGQITDLNVYINLSHQRIADLEIYLESPTGTEISLVDGIACSEAELLVTLDSSASTSIDSVACSSSITGTYQPTESLAGFNGEGASGDWTLHISDNDPDNIGTLWNWDLEIDTDNGVLAVEACDDCVVPIPADGSGGTTGITISELPVAPSGNSEIYDLNLIVDLDHTAIGGLEIFLVSPAGDNIKVFDQACGDSNHLEVIYDDEAGGSLNCASRLGFNRFQPSAAPLASYDGDDATGTWKLVVVDYAPTDTGVLNNWSLEFKLV